MQFLFPPSLRIYSDRRPPVIFLDNNVLQTDPVFIDGENFFDQFIQRAGLSVNFIIVVGTEEAGQNVIDSFCTPFNNGNKFFLLFS